MNKTTKTQMLIYEHERLHPVGTSSTAYKELAQRAMELETELDIAKETISEMQQGFIVESRTTKTHG